MSTRCVGDPFAGCSPGASSRRRRGGPSRRRVLAHAPVDGLPQQVRVTRVPGVLLEQVEQEPSQARVGVGVALPGARHRVVVQRVEGPRVAADAEGGVVGAVPVEPRPGVAR